MPNLLHIVKIECLTALKNAFPDLSEHERSSCMDVTAATQEKFGHYQCNAAMKLSKRLHQPPRHIAEQIKLHLEKVTRQKTPLFSLCEIAGPGFINLTLKPAFLMQELSLALLSDRLAVDPSQKARRIIMDFSSPNVAKEPHVGHLRSTIIGDCLSRLFSFLGADVVRLNHVGDWGTSFGMLIAYMQENVPNVLNGKQETTLTDLVEWYRAAKLKFDEDDAFKTRSRLQVVTLQGGDPLALKQWELICSISRKALQEVYDLLDVHLTERGESFYNPMLAPLIEDLSKKGILHDSHGAQCLFLEGFLNREGEPLPFMVQKSDGGYTYATTDMAALRHRVEQERAQRIIYVTDAGQATHFQMLFEAGKQAGYYDPKKVELNHVPFGLVLGADGKKFRTRSGETERLIDLLQAAVSKADEILVERGSPLSPQERHALAKALGIGAVKYADLSTHRLSDYSFSYERMLKFEGNTAAFILYAYVRIEGIKRKVGLPVELLKESGTIVLEQPSELALGMHLLRFEETLDAMTHDLLPSHLTDYLYGLAEKFHAFFRDCRVEGAPQQTSRLLLADVTSRTLAKGLSLLGIPVVEKM